jgi:glycosyltransferase involved in cell wall biosynthesis
MTLLSKKKISSLSGKAVNVKPSLGIIALLPDKADCPWMARHQLLSRLTTIFKIIWVVPAIEWREAWFRNGKENTKDKFGFAEHKSGLILFNSTRWLPKIYKPKFLSIFIQYMRFKLIISYLKYSGCNKIILYITRPDLLPDINLNMFNLVCYHVFDEYSFSSVKVDINRNERDLIERCDLPIFTSKLLLEEKGVYNPGSIYIPNGVDLEMFRKKYEIPEEVKNISKPIIGYSGVIKKQLDLELLLNLSKNNSNWSFVFVGPIMNVKGSEKYIDELYKMKNVHFLGKKNHDELPAYIQNFDVGVLPYVNNNYTKYITPLKLNEYMAAGIHIVGRKIIPLNSYKDCIYLADSLEEWECSIRLALEISEENVNKNKKAYSIVNKFNWDSLAKRLQDSLIDSSNRK